VLLGNVALAVDDAEKALRHGPPSPRLCYNVARIFAQASTQVDSLRNAKAVERWQERAVALLAQALDMQPAAEAAPFWHNVVYADQALNPLRRNQAFKQLAARYPAPPAGTLPKIVVQPKR
jgi:hypothetical protein